MDDQQLIAALKNIQAQLEEAKKREETLSEKIKRRTRKAQSGNPNANFFTSHTRGTNGRIVARHYNAHNMNEGVSVPEPERPAKEKLFVYCVKCAHTHPLIESVYVDMGPTKGKHWVCKDHANGYEEVVIHT